MNDGDSQGAGVPGLPENKKFKRVTKRMGRPPKLSPELIEKIATYVRAGNYIETSAIGCGVEKATLYLWMKGANADKAAIQNDPTHARNMSRHQRLQIDFLDAVEKALAEGEMADVITIRKAAARNWQAAAWRLERKFPKKWGRNDQLKLEASGPGGGPMKTENVNTNLTPVMTDEENDAILARHFERMKPNEHSPDGSPATEGPAETSTPA